jgi:hypothetical protein
MSKYNTFYKSNFFFFILVAPLKYFPVTKKLPIHLCTYAETKRESWRLTATAVRTAALTRYFINYLKKIKLIFFFFYIYINKMLGKE